VRLHVDEVPAPAQRLHDLLADAPLDVDRQGRRRVDAVGLVGQADPRRLDGLLDVGLYPIVTLEKQLPDMIENWYKDSGQAVLQSDNRISPYLDVHAEVQHVHDQLRRRLRNAEGAGGACS
jgi:hypothetical protein